MIPGKYPVSTHRVSWERNKNKKQCLIFTPRKAQGGELFLMEIQDSLGSHIGVPYFCKAPVPGFYITHKMRGPIRGTLCQERPWIGVNSK